MKGDTTTPVPPDGLTLNTKFTSTLTLTTPGWDLLSLSLSPEISYIATFTIQEGFSGPCDLMICFGTFHRLANVNTSLNSKTLDAKKEKRNLFGKTMAGYNL